MKTTLVPLMAAATAGWVLSPLFARAGRRRRLTEREVITPPLPRQVVQLLDASQMCFLATSDDGDPHLSLMMITYAADKDGGDCLVLTTRRNTKKFMQIENSRSVAVLVHDFPHLRSSSGSGNTASVTLSGIAEEVTGEEGERLRAVHLAHNPDYAQFIHPPTPHNVAVIKITIETARICDIRDKVTTWNRAQ